MPLAHRLFNQSIAFRLASHQNGQAVGLGGIVEMAQWNSLTGITGN
jgi:hypothetical protein